MKQKNRIKNNNTFVSIITNHKPIINNYYLLFYVKNNLSECRFGISVGKRIKKAVTRNKIKRQIRAVLRETMEKIKIPVDVIIIVRPGIEKLSFQDKKENLMSIMKRAKLI
ncbi:MAG: ribonuclease P protein component [Bacilli bacterium]|nr:ribonuclease P protein component [Bacilli bacterium]